MLSGGSGITPVMSMIRTLRDRKHTGEITFLHYARSRADEMFSDELDAARRRNELPHRARLYPRTRQRV